MNRRALVAVTASVGAVGLLSLLLLFVASLAPARDKALRSLDVSVSEVPLGEYKLFVWLNRPVAVFRPTPELLRKLQAETQLTGHGVPIPTPPPAAFIYYFESTHLGCALKHAPSGPRYPGDTGWPGGFYDPCHYGEWDYAGRTLNRPGSTPNDILLPDLAVPKYKWLSPETVRLHVEA